MNGHGSQFTRKMEAAVSALLNQRNVEEAARVVGISSQTLHRWQKVPEFQAAYREARRAVFHQGIARLQQASSAAVSTLLRIMADPSSPAPARVRAADRVLVHGKYSVEYEDIEARVAVLEQALAANAPKPPKAPRGSG